MTTIAVRWGVIAADSQSIRGSLIQPGETQKLFRLNDGGVAAVVGDYAPACRFVEWMNASPENRGDDPGCGDATVIVFAPDCSIIVHESGGRYVENKSEFNAFGSGAMAALAAMHMGADAVKAVQVASLLDTGTGGPVMQMKWKP